jgi:hypothetical protein
VEHVPCQIYNISQAYEFIAGWRKSESLDSGAIHLTMVKTAKEYGFFAIPGFGESLGSGPSA